MNTHWGSSASGAAAAPNHWSVLSTCMQSCEAVAGQGTIPEVVRERAREPGERARGTERDIAEESGTGGGEGVPLWLVGRGTR